ncbi:MAG: hypothetical protein WCK86_15285 [Planctomycetia bacterium]
MSSLRFTENQWVGIAGVVQDVWTLWGSNFRMGLPGEFFMQRLRVVLMSLLKMHWRGLLISLGFSAAFSFVTIFFAQDLAVHEVSRARLSDEILPSYWSYATRQSLFDFRDPESIRLEAQQLGPDGALEFCSAENVLQRLASASVDVGASEPDLQRVLGGVRRLQFSKGTFSKEDWQVFAHLQDLEVLELHGVGRTAGDTSEQSMAAAAAALSSLPRLHTLILSGELSVDPGQMPQLQTLAIELGDVERVLRAGAAERFPKLHTVLLRLPETPVVTEGQLAALRSLPQLQALRLWTGEETTRRVLTEYIDEFRAYFPQLSVQRCEWGMPFVRSILLYVLMTLTTMLLAVMTFVLTGRFSLSTNAVVPGLLKTHLQLLGGLYLLAAAAGVAVAFSLYLRLWMPVLWCLLSVAVSQLISARVFRSGQISPWTGPIVGMLWLVQTRLSQNPMAFASSAIHGDYWLLNLITATVCAGLIVLSFRESRQLHRFVAKNGLMETNGNKSLNSPIRSTLLTGDLADRLRSVSGMSFRNVACFLAYFLLIYLISAHFLMNPTASGYFSMIQLSFFCFILPTMCFFLVTATWRQRISRLTSDFLLPVSRLNFWRAMSQGVFRDLRFVYLAIIVLMPGSLLLGEYDGFLNSESNAESRYTLALLLGMACCGMCALHHGLLLLSASGKWLTRTLSVMMTLVPLFVIVLSITAVSYLPISLFPFGIVSTGIVLAGAALQWKLLAILQKVELIQK